MSKTDSDLNALHDDLRWASYLGRVKEAAKVVAALWIEAWKTPYADQLSEEERVAGLSKFWAEVKYNFVFTDTLKKLDWDAVYLKSTTSESSCKHSRVLPHLDGDVRALARWAYQCLATRKVIR